MKPLLLLLAATVSTVDKDAVSVDRLLVSSGKVAGGPLDGTPAEDLVEVAFSTDGSGAPAGAWKAEARLVSGDVLLGELGAAREGGITFRSAVLGELALKIEHLKSLVFAERAPGPALAALRDRMAADREGMKEDLCYLVDGDRVRLLVRSLDASGVRGDDGAGAALDLAAEKVAAVALLSTSPPPEAPGLRVRLSTLDGGSLVGALDSVREEAVVLVHPILGRLEVPLERCAALQVLGGRIVNLSDLAPSAVKEMPYLRDPADPEGETVFRWRRDAQVIDGRLLVLRGRPYARGIGAHAYSELTWDLGGAYARFRSDVGIDDSAGGGGSADAAVLLDEKECFRMRVTGRDPARRVDVDCRGASRLTLLVDFGEDREVLDRVAWAGAVLVKERR